MSTPVRIRRLTATTHQVPGSGIDAARAARLLNGVAQRRLDRAVGSLTLPPGTWCVRRIDVPVQLDPQAPDGILEEAWAATLATALATSLADPQIAVRYDGTADALADLVAGAATGRLERLWAWRQLGLVRPGDPDPAHAPGEAIVAALAGQPEQAVPSLEGGLERCGAAALHRCLGAPGWVLLAGLAARATGRSWTPGPAGAVATRPAEQAPAGGAPRTPLPPGTRQLAQRLISRSRLAALLRAGRIVPDPATAAAWAVLVIAGSDPSVISRSHARPILAELARQLRGDEPDQPAPRPDCQPPVSQHESPSLAPHGSPAAAADEPPEGPGPAIPGDGDAVPAPGEQWPHGSQTGPDPARDPAWDPAWDPARDPAGDVPGDRDLDAAPAAPPESPLPGSQRPEPVAAQAGSVDVQAGPGQAGDDRVPAADPLPSRDGFEPAAIGDEAWRATSWAGLLFLLAVARRAGIPDDVLDHPGFADRPLPWVIQGVATRLGVPAGDPAAAALSGQDPAGAQHWLTSPPPSPEQAALLDAIATRWAQSALDALASLDPFPAVEVPVSGVRAAVTWVLRRDGEIGYTRGWIDVRLPLASVDLRIRRAGLDLDPGWVPWLGTVVRYRYV